ncbi:hypothetical protein ATG70_0436 [Bacillus sp. es.036]|nr:hypothetical protein ATG70_0436 [Bacillus sp. es.036]
MIFLKSMTNRQIINWKKGAIIGFYTYLILLFINYTHNLIFTGDFFSSAVIFWSGLIVALGYEVVLNLNDKRKIRKNLD